MNRPLATMCLALALFAVDACGGGSPSKTATTSTTPGQTRTSAAASGGATSANAGSAASRLPLPPDACKLLTNAEAATLLRQANAGAPLRVFHLNPWTDCIWGDQAGGALALTVESDPNDLATVKKSGQFEVGSPVSGLGDFAVLNDKQGDDAVSLNVIYRGLVVEVELSNPGAKAKAPAIVALCRTVLGRLG